MNRQTIKQELETLAEQRNAVDLYSEEEKRLWSKYSDLKDLLNNMEKMEDCDDELIQIYEMNQKIKEIEKAIKEKEQEMFLKKGFKKGVNFSDNEKNYVMVSDTHFRVLKKDGTFSIKETARKLSVYNVPSFKIN